MQNKGTILIVDDRIQEKIGTFKDILNVEGYNVMIAETLKTADNYLNTLLKSNSLSGIVLDFSFPVDEEDLSVSTNNRPNGVELFEKYKFKITTQRIPVVINTTGDEEYKKKYLGDIKNIGTPMYNVNHQSNPLAQPANMKMIRDILKMFNERNEVRKIEPDKKWTKKSGSIVFRNGKYEYNDRY